MYRELETIVLRRPFPEHGLVAGDIGAIVHVHADGGAFEVEFVTAGGDTLAVLTLDPGDVRHSAGAEILHVRSLALA